MAHEVFISYSSVDKNIADDICSALEASDIKCWIAPRDITPGKEWGEEIIKGINESKIMVLVFSEATNDSQQVLREIERAVNKNVIVIPFRIEDVEPTKSLEYFLYSTHWLDAFNADLKNKIKKLKETVEKLLAEYNSKKFTEKCSKCRIENELENKYCKKCGQQLDTEKSKEDILKEIQEAVFLEGDEFGQKFYQKKKWQLLVAGFLLIIGLVIVFNAIDRDQQISQEVIGEEQQDIEDIYTSAESYYQHGEYEKAFELYEMAADEGYAAAQERLADMYYQGLGIAADYERALALYRQSAEQGYAEAQYILGYMYMSGSGVERNDEQAEEWYLKAAEQGHKNAQVALGAMYKYGLGIAVDLQEAEKWYQKAAEQGSETAKKELEEL